MDLYGGAVCIELENLLVSCMMMILYKVAGVDMCVHRVHIVRFVSV